jgi:hypothetical protein
MSNILSSTNILIFVVAAVVLLGVLSLIMARQKNKKQLHGQFKPEYDLTVKTMGGEKQAQTELNERQKHVDGLEIHPLSVTDGERYSTEWAAIQSKFVDEPGQAVMDADRLTIEVLQARGYPVSDFDQRAADISIKYPGIVTSYRAAREITVKNEQKLADTEELRQAFIHYRSLFEELLKASVK